MRPEKLAE